MKKVIIYPGRFQPMMRHHAQVFSWLQSQFPEGEVYIATSDKTDGESSPFSFAEKQQIAALGFGLPAQKMLQVRNPYDPLNYPFDTESTVMIFVVGAKDMRPGSERFKFDNLDPETGLNMQVRDPTRPTHIQPISTMGRDPLPAKYRAYIYVTENILDEEGEAAKTSSFRKQLRAAPDTQTAKKVFVKYYGEYNQQLFDLLYSKIVEPKMKKIDPEIQKMRKLAGMPELEESAPVEFQGISDQKQLLGELGRILMDKAVKEKNDTLSNLMARAGNMFTRYGTDGEPSTLSELAAKLNIDEDAVLKLAEFAQAVYNDEGPVEVPSDENFVDDTLFTEGNSERPYICLHVKKGRHECHANTSYEAAKKAASHWGLKSTAGIDTYLADVNHVATEDVSTNNIAEQEEMITKRVVGHPDSEARMMQRELLKISDYANDLLRMLDDLQDGDFPHWWQAKLVKAGNYMSSIKHFLDGEQRLGPRQGGSVLQPEPEVLDMDDVVDPMMDRLG